MLTAPVRVWRRSSATLQPNSAQAAIHPLVVRSAAVHPTAAAPATIGDADEPKRSTTWPAARLALTNRLWGDGFLLPGGENEIMRLARPLGASTAANVLILGVGSGGPASAIVSNLGASVIGMDNDPSLLAAARGLITRSHQQKKVSIKAWNPHDPVLEAKAYHHCLALEPFHNAQPEPVLDALVRALKAGGQVVINALAAPVPLKPTDPVVRRWAELEHRDPAGLLAPVAVTRMLGRVGMDVRAAEDISQRHLEQAILGWRVMMHAMDGNKPTRPEAVQLVTEAELWLLRQRLLRDGRLMMMRWNARSHLQIV